MITSIRLVDFKNFADETLRVGPFTVIVGTNASGKSNIRDAFRFLHGIGRGYTLAEIMGGKFGAGQRIWEPIRGALNEIIRFGHPASDLRVEFEVDGRRGRYSIRVNNDVQRRGRFEVTYEELRIEDKKIYEYRRDLHGLDRILVGRGSGKDRRAMDRYLRVSRDQPALTQFYESRHIGFSAGKECAGQTIDILESMRFLDFSPDLMREPAFAGMVLGDRGENLPAVLEDVCADSNRKKVLARWVRELTPMDVTDFKFPRDPSNSVHLVLEEVDGKTVSADSASDGTLRFLAMLSTLLDTKSKGLYFFEEVDNGIHSARQSLLLELIEKQTAKGGIQVITTTHSPSLLTFVNDDTFEHTSVVCRPEDSSDAIIRPLAQMPNAPELRTSQGLGRLLMGGWMETTLAFTEGNDENGENEG